MPVLVDIAHPDDNVVDLDPAFVAGSSGRVTIRGRRNRIHIGHHHVASTANFTLDGGATVRVGSDSNLGDLEVYAGDGALVEIGAWCSFSMGCAVTAHEPSSILIGNFCLFGAQCRVASSDVHRVLDRATGRRLNPAGDIILGDHVWVAPNSLILRNAILGRRSVVGAGSIVRDAFPAHVLVAGAPARIVREGIDWAF